VRTDQKLYGNIYDHFYVIYEFDNDIRLHASCRQQDNTATQVMDYIIGTKGVANVQRHTIKSHDGKTLWRHVAPRGRDAKPDNMYQNEHDDMFAAIRAGKQIYNGDYMCKSTMMAIMGRMAAYTGQRLTWDQVWNSKDDLAPAKYEWGPNPVRPVARPGVTQFA
jgi:myo-inositol 2-dehydrogenase / D-chiro-inositol 1-dehydrogenase